VERSSRSPRKRTMSKPMKMKTNKPTKTKMKPKMIKMKTRPSKMLKVAVLKRRT
jgi:hypothetical protein